ncbi:MAG: amidase domain-containing protein [Oscillospiraceae bacterium]
MLQRKEKQGFQVVPETRENHEAGKEFRVKKRMISVALAMIVFVSALSVPSFAYSRANAINYADTYALYSNPSHMVYFSNCANFVSQCLKAGGVQMDDTWWFKAGYKPAYNTYSTAWVRADSLKNYMKNNLQATRLVSKWKKTANSAKNEYAYVDNSNNLINYGITVIFYDWQDDGIIDHTSIMVGTGNALDGTGYGDLIDQNTTNRKQTIWHLDSYNGDKLTTAIYAFRIV